jgi:hypothetical protein
MLEFVGHLSGQLLLLLVFSVFAIPFVLLRRRAHRSDRQRLLSSGERSTGKAVEVWRDPQGWNVTYEFHPRGTKALVRRTETFEAVASSPVEAGAQVEIAHEGRAPYYSVLVL